MPGAPPRVPREAVSVPPAGGLVQPAVDEVCRQRHAQDEEHADPPRRRVAAAALVRMQEDKDRRRRIDRPGDEKRRCREACGQEHTAT